MRKLSSFSIVAASLALAGTAGATPISTGPVAGFYTNDDHLGHAIVAATTDGGYTFDVHELYYSGPTEVGLAPGAAIPHGDAILNTFWHPVLGVAGYFSPFDGNRHAIVALANGQNTEVDEIWYSPSVGINTDILFNLNTWYGTITQIVGYATPDLFQHVFVMTSKGHIWQYRFSPYCSSNCGTNYGFIYYMQTDPTDRITAFWDPDAQKEHLVVQTNAPAIADGTFNGDGNPAWQALPNPNSFGTFVQIAAVHVGPNYVTKRSSIPYTMDIMQAESAAQSGLEEYGYTPGGNGEEIDSVNSIVSPGVLGLGAWGDPDSEPGIVVKHAVVMASDGNLYDYWVDNRLTNYNYTFTVHPLGQF